MDIKKIVSDYVKSKGIEIEDFNKAVDELCKNGIAKGCFQDYNILICILEIIGL